MHIVISFDTFDMGQFVLYTYNLHTPSDTSDIAFIFCTNISHMHVCVKLLNYPHLYYFSHFTHFTLYLRTCEKYQILFNFVLISKFPITIMETSTLFPRHLEKHKFLLRSIEGVAFLTRDIIPV